MIQDLLRPCQTEMPGRLDGATKARLRALTGEIARQRPILYLRAEPRRFDDIKVGERWFD